MFNLICEVNMSTYEKLVYFASNPNDKNNELRNSKGEILDSVDLVVLNLKSEFLDNPDFVVDFRKACETAVSA